MSRFKRTEILKFPRQSSQSEESRYWSQLGDPVTIQEYGAITTIDVSPADPSLVACTSYNKIQIYNVATVELYKSLTKFQDTVYSGKFRGDGALLCAGTGQGEVKVFDVSAKTQLRVLSGHTAAVQAASFTFGEAGVVSWSDDKTVKVWDLPTETALHTLSLHTDYVRAGAVCAEQPNMITSGSYDHTVAVWDRRDLTRPSLTLQHGAPVENVLVLPGGGLLASLGGSEVKVWDLVGGGKLLTTLSHHHKTVTCSTVSKDGRCLVTGGLDRQIVWTDISTLSKVSSKHCPASVMSVGVGDQDNYLVVGMLEGQVQIHKRKEEKVEDGMIVNSRRYKKARNHKYLQFTQYTPAQTDTVVSDIKKDIELRHDYLLRKFEYSKALDAVLKPFVARKKPEYTYSLLMELIRRDGLVKALAGRDEKQLCLLLQFINKYLADQRFSKLCFHVSNILIDLYLPHHGMSSRVDNLFSDMLRKLDREVNYLETLMELTGAVDLLLSSVTTKHVEASPSAVEHRVCALPC